MKLQYLGDSKDALKWDFLDYLASEQDFPLLRILWMMTPPENTQEGSTHPTLFPARHPVLDLCHRLRDTRDPGLLAERPVATGARYAVEYTDPTKMFDSESRATYFDTTLGSERQLLFLDPDNGFEPKHCTEKHGRYSEARAKQKPSAVLTVLSVENFPT